MSLSRDLVTADTTAEAGMLLARLAALQIELDALKAALAGDAWTSTAHPFAAACRLGRAQDLARHRRGESIIVADDRTEPHDAAPEAQDRSATCEQPRAREPRHEVPVFANPLGDDFTLIRGIDDEMAAVLQSFGLTHYRDLASFFPEDVAIIGRTISDPRRLSREGWIEQAALLSRGIMTDYARERLSSAGLARASGTEPLSSPPMEPPVFDAGQSARDPSAAPNILRFPSERAQKRRGATSARWMAAAACASLLAAASASSLGMSPPFAHYLGSIACSDTLRGVLASCGQLTWLAQ